MVGLEAGFEIENEFYDKEKIEQEEHMVDIKIKEFQMKTGENNEEPYYIISLLKWIQNEIHIQEVEMKTNFDKVNLKIESEEDVTHVISLFRELKLILSEDSNDPDIKQDLLRKERFTEEEAHWPNRWFLHIHCSWNPISPKTFVLPHVEEFGMSTKYEYDKTNVLPYGIGLFKHLKKLNLSHSYVPHLPIDIQFCKNLEEIQLCNNLLKNLPGFLLNMPKLKTVTRNGNCLDPNPPLEMIWKKDEISAASTSNSVINSPKTLAQLSAVSLSTNNSFYKLINDWNLGRHFGCLIYNSINYVNLCDNCGKGMKTETTYNYSLLLKRCWGCNHLPFKGCCCSYQCAVDRITFIQEKYEIYENPIYEQNEDSDTAKVMSNVNATKYFRFKNLFRSCWTTR